MWGFLHPQIHGYRHDPRNKALQNKFGGNFGVTFDGRKVKASPAMISEDSSIAPPPQTPSTVVIVVKKPDAPKVSGFFVINIIQCSH